MSGTNAEKKFKEYLLTPKNTNEKLDNFTDYEKAINRRYSQLTNIPNSTLLNDTHDDSLSVLSEISPSDRFKKIGDVLQLPMFEVQKTMLSLRFNNKATELVNKKSTEHEVKKENLHDMNAYRKWTIDEIKAHGIENMTAQLSSTQRQYFTIMNSFKTNYLSHVLNNNKVYFQYVSMSKQNLSFLNSEKFTKEYKLNLAQKEKFAKNIYKYHGKKTLVLDLDETLILATKKKPAVYDAALTYNGRDLIYLKLRPFLKEFLEDMQELYELIIYTSADRVYADNIINFIEQDQLYFSHRLYQLQCLRRGNKYLFKNLELLCSNRSISDIIIVDNLVINYSLSVRNGIPILDYKGDDNDYQLVHLAAYLRKLATETNLQEAINRDFAAFLLKHYEST